MAIRTRADALNVWTGVQSKEIFRASRLVSQLTGMVVQRNKAIVGANAFAHEAGIHQDGMLKERTTYEIMHPADVGIQGTELVLGKHSGRRALREHLVKMGLRLNPEELEQAYVGFIALADKKKTVYDDDLVAIVQDLVLDVPQVYTLEYLHVSTGNKTVPTATVRLRKSGETFEDAACGDGPIDAALKTIDRISGVTGRLLDFSLQAITQGKDAMGEVSLRVAYPDDIVSGKGSSTDIVEAGAKAYLNCLNRHLSVGNTRPAKKAPGTRRKTTGPKKKKAGSAKRKT
jgi:2-isopropylmalate synthase